VRTIACLAVLLVSCAARAPAQDPFDPFPALGELATEGRQLSFGVGMRAYEDPDFGRLDEPIALALDYCEPMGFRRLRLEGGLHYTYDEADDQRSGGEDVRLQATTLELSAGVNWSILLGRRLRPYVGGGAALQFLNLRGLDTDIDAIFDDDDASFGGYAKAGLAFQVSQTTFVGVEARHFEGGDVDLDGTELGTSYDQFLIVFGTSLAPKRP
jgi:opacity protein-like surface antigen